VGSFLLGLVLATLSLILPAPVSTVGILTIYSCASATLFFGGSSAEVRTPRFIAGATLALELLGQQRLGFATLVSVSLLIVSHLLSERTRIITRHLRFLACSLLIDVLWIAVSAPPTSWLAHLGPLLIATWIGLAVTYLGNRNRSLSTELIQ